MGNKETRLQKICRQCAKKIARAIIEEVESGKELERGHLGAEIDGVFIVKTSVNNYPTICLNLDQKEIEELFEPNKYDLSKKAEELRKELEEIENKLKQ